MASGSSERGITLCCLLWHHRGNVTVATSLTVRDPNSLRESSRSSSRSITFTRSPAFRPTPLWGEAALCRAEFVEQHVHVPEGFEP